MVSANRRGSAPEPGVERPDAPVFAPGPDGLAHLELILNGAYPLPGFMTRDEAEAVEREGRLPDGRPWPVPVTLEVPAELSGADHLTLTDPEGAPLAGLAVTEHWRGADGRPRLAGVVTLLRPPTYGVLRELRPSPPEMRAQRELEPSGRPLLAVVTDRPLHHRALHQIRAEADALGRTHGDGVRAEVLVIVDTGLEDEGMATAVLAAEPLLPARTSFVVCTLPRSADRSRGALGGAWGPRQVALAAHVAAAYGATHMIAVTGGDGPDVERVMARRPPLTVLDPEPWRYSSAEGLWLPLTRVDPAEARSELTDEQVEAELAHGRELPSWFTPARVGAELSRLRPARTRRGLTVLFTGLSGSGKSTIARGVCDGIRRSGRSVTLLDGDVVRRMLSSELTFSREHRELNIRRIGYVASEVTRHGGITVCAPIAPYAGGRAEVRAMVEEFGDFFLVHVATPLEVCEARDRKGLYAKARAGLIPEFTGISDPYEEPEDADLVVDTEGMDPADSVARVMAALREGGWLPEHDGRSARAVEDE
ncbi:adenylyl-sulfate kinase [Nocardiopsis sp. TSRI0078]|uniref:adenylyl-sulfate kinase n=1 Tax=unclassified Nocardiopsis TaxID=2649073 RepID=UPI00093EE431|nr:adenylyl-sulfate kinase [Nocardiopsis sp. TSRI0078]OKI14393.1 adenylyl-sulfate kinase [Nocardiopsis sp. TSRI0078]